MESLGSVAPLPAWAAEPSPFSGPWSEVLAYSGWYALFPDAPPFDQVTPLRKVLVRQNVDHFPRVLSSSTGLLDTKLAHLIDAGPGALRRRMTAVDAAAVKRTLRAFEHDSAGPDDEARAAALLVLLAPAAHAFTSEIVALAIQKRAARPQLPTFYAPLYLSNACTNHCTYCGFHVKNPTPRQTLDDAELAREAEVLRAAGHQQVLLLTGESPKDVPLERLASAVRILRQHFDGVGLEVYPLSHDGYDVLRAAGATSVTVYQETYDVELYRCVHRAGRKRNFLHRLGTPERGALAGLDKVSLGVLLGLTDPSFDAYALGLHALELQRLFPELCLGMSFPRMQPADSESPTPRPVGDPEFLRIVAALRLVFPEAEFSLSTRERPALRDRFGPVLFDWMSAGCSTEPGGYARRATNARSLPQFEIADHRSLDEVRAACERTHHLR